MSIKQIYYKNLRNLKKLMGFQRQKKKVYNYITKIKQKKQKIFETD